MINQFYDAIIKANEGRSLCHLKMMILSGDSVRHVTGARCQEAVSIVFAPLSQ